jgi:hypothetical protein
VRRVLWTKRYAGLRQAIVALPSTINQGDGMCRSPANQKRLRRRGRFMERGIVRSINRRDGKEKAKEKLIIARVAVSHPSVIPHLRRLPGAKVQRRP